MQPVSVRPAWSGRANLALDEPARAAGVVAPRHRYGRWNPAFCRESVASLRDRGL